MRQNIANSTLVPTTVHKENELEMILFAILALIIFFGGKRFVWLNNCYKMLTKQPYNYYALLGLLILGFFTKLDYTEAWGCIVARESIFEYKNVLFSSVSILLILISFFLQPRVFKLVFVLIELAYWVFKLFYFKGGYVVGLGAGADPVISFYDSSTLFLRLLIINGLLKNEFNIIYILATTLVIMAIKVHGFPMNFNMLIEDKRSLQRAEDTKAKIFGEWTGICKYDAVDLSQSKPNIDSVKIRFDKNAVMFYNFMGFDSIYLNVTFRSEFSGFVQNEADFEEKIYADIWIRKIDSDSLNLVINQSLTMYEFGLIKLNALYK